MDATPLYISSRGIDQDMRDGIGGDGLRLVKVPAAVQGQGWDAAHCEKEGGNAFKERR